MSLQVSRQPTLTAGWYLTSLAVRRSAGSGDAQLLAPGGAVDLPLTGSWVDIQRLAYQSAGSPDVGVEVETATTVLVDDLKVEAWEGKHTVADVGKEPAPVAADDNIMGGRAGVSLVDACMVMDRTADAAQFSDSARPGWTLIVALRRTVSVFSGQATIFALGSLSADTNQLVVQYDQDGYLRVRHTLDGVTWAGRRTAAGAVPVDTDLVLAISGRSGQGYRIYSAGTRIDTTDVGDGSAIAPKDLTDWATTSPDVAVGASIEAGDSVTSPGGPDLYRLLWVSHVDWYADEHAVKKASKRVELEYRLGE